jgi:hypothetical protein
MTPAKIAAAIDPNSFQGFLVYGPLGLAGLVLVLVVMAMSLRKDVSESSERLLRLVLFVGAFCFIAALLAQHFTPVQVASAPQDFSKQRSILVNVEKTLTDAAPALDDIDKLASDQGGCPGGSHGVPIPHGAQMAAASARVQGALGGVIPYVRSVMQSLPARP